MADDVMAILDAIDRERGESFIGMIQANQVQRLRTEIVALRRTIMLGPDLPALARAQALEEAALECEARFCDGCADAIRALKDKDH